VALLARVAAPRLALVERRVAALWRRAVDVPLVAGVLRTWLVERLVRLVERVDERLVEGLEERLVVLGVWLSAITEVTPSNLVYGSNLRTVRA